MIKNSLTGKLFVFIMVLFITQVVIQFGFQRFFLAGFYENQKIEYAETTFHDTVEKFSKAENMDEKSDLLYEYMAETNEPILVFNRYDDYHTASYLTSFKQTISVDIDGNIYLLPFNGIGLIEFEDLEKSFSKELIGEEVLVFAYEEKDTITPFGFEYEGYYFDAFLLSDEYSDLTDEEFYEDQNRVSEHSYVEKLGVIIDLEEKFIDNTMQKKIDDLSEYHYESLYGGETEFDDYNFMIEIVRVNHDVLTFVSALSLQPINEVLAIQSKFQIYLTTFMIVLIIVVSYIFSKVISKPIVSISHSTAAIANMNFDVRCDESRRDEIGTLGKSINILSKSLKLKIDTLESEIEFEKRQEKIRREFVADVSHELKTPLGVIKSFSEGIMDGISKDKSDYYLQVILQEVDKMNALVLDMLELSNLELGERAIKIEKINMKRMVSNLLRNFEQTMTGMTVHIELEDTMVDVDVQKMELVINNVLCNAFRYVNDEKIINITLSHRELIIENSYECIKKEEFDKIWNRFYRLEKSRSKSFGGNGLGLAIVKKTLDLHDLDYCVENSSIGFLFKISF